MAGSFPRPSSRRSSTRIEVMRAWVRGYGWHKPAWLPEKLILGGLATLNEKKFPGEDPRTPALLGVLPLKRGVGTPLKSVTSQLFASGPDGKEKHPRLLGLCHCIALVLAKKINLYLSVSNCNMDPIHRPKCAGSRIAAGKLTPCRSKITCSLAHDHRSCHQTQTECTPLMVENWIPQASVRPICNLEGMFLPPQFMCSRTSKLHFSVKVHAFIWDCWKRIGPSVGFRQFRVFRCPRKITKECQCLVPETWTQQRANLFLLNLRSTTAVSKPLHVICAGTTMLPLYWRKLRLHYTCLLPSPIVISYLQQLFGNSTLHLYDRAWSIAMLCGVARQPGLWSHWKRCSWKSQEPLFTRSVGNRDLRCFRSVTFQRLRGGGGSIVCVSCTFCIKAKVHRRYLSFFRQLFKLEQK